jgi:hypothetical protein
MMLVMMGGGLWAAFRAWRSRRRGQRAPEHNGDERGTDGGA